MRSALHTIIAALAVIGFWQLAGRACADGPFESKHAKGVQPARHLELFTGPKVTHAAACAVQGAPSEVSACAATDTKERVEACAAPCAKCRQSQQAEQDEVVVECEVTDLPAASSDKDQGKQDLLSEILKTQHALTEQIERLQRQVEQATAALPRDEQVVFQFKVWEISHKKLRELGIDFAWGQGSIARTYGQNGPSVIVPVDSPIFDVLEALKANGMAKVLANPAVVTNSGKAGHFRVGYDWRGVSYGTTIDIVSHVHGDDSVSCELRTRITRDASRLDPDTKRPVVEEFECDASAELASGQALILGGKFLRNFHFAVPAKLKSTDDEVEWLLIVQPEVVASHETEEVVALPPVHDRQ
jgi:hypothetical protein